MSKKNEATAETTVPTEAPVKVTWTPEQAESFIKEKGSVSAAIRFLLAEGKSRGEVAKLLHKRYQHVRNVQITPLKKAG